MKRKDETTSMRGVKNWNVEMRCHSLTQSDLSNAHNPTKSPSFHSFRGAVLVFATQDRIDEVMNGKVWASPSRTWPSRAETSLLSGLISILHLISAAFGEPKYLVWSTYEVLYVTSCFSMSSRDPPHPHSYLDLSRQPNLSNIHALPQLR